MTDFKKILIMIIAFVLLLITVVTEVTARFTFTDFGLLIFVMIFVSVVPALGGVAYKWMNAENEDDEKKQEQLRKKRTNILFPIALVFIVVTGIRLIFKFFV